MPERPLGRDAWASYPPQILPHVRHTKLGFGRFLGAECPWQGILLLLPTLLATVFQAVGFVRCFCCGCVRAKPVCERSFTQSAGEHCLHTAGVTGSIPVAPTIFLDGLAKSWWLGCPAAGRKRAISARLEPPPSIGDRDDGVPRPSPAKPR